MLAETSYKTIHKDIAHFLATNKIATVCCSAENKPYCFNCFYALLEDEGNLVFKSSQSSRHISIISENSSVAGTIVASEITMAKIEGIQFEGAVIDMGVVNLRASKAYYLRYPFAVTVPGRLWVLELRSVRYTNTTNGIKRKLDWER